MPAAEMLERYARLIATYGLNVQPGQIVQIAADVAHRELAVQVNTACYRAGAKYVHIDLHDTRMVRDRLLTADENSLAFTPPWITTRWHELVEYEGANVKIVGPEFPEILKGLEPSKVNAVRRSQYEAAKEFYEEGMPKSKVHWCVVAGVTPAWAARVYPELPEDQAVETLWKTLFSICRVDQSDFLESWHRHNELLKRRAAWLNESRIRQLHFQGPGTDLVVGLTPVSIFVAGTERSSRGVDFEPNIPTEECFTTPDWKQTEGSVSATRPFFVNGVRVSGLKMEFKSGEIRAFSCDEGRDVFETYLSSDEGAKRLGEVALVGCDSPIYRTGRVFEEILLDENAACHVAVGMSYATCLRDGGSMSRDERRDLGANESSVHTDIMISSEQVDVTAVDASKTRTKIISRGSWML